MVLSLSSKKNNKHKWNEKEEERMHWQSALCVCVQWIVAFFSWNMCHKIAIRMQYNVF